MNRITSFLAGLLLSFGVAAQTVTTTGANVAVNTTNIGGSTCDFTSTGLNQCPIGATTPAAITGTALVGTSLNIGSGALTAGATSVTTLTASSAYGSNPGLTITATGGVSNSTVRLDSSAGNGYGSSIQYRSATSGGTVNQWAVGTGLTGGTNAFEFYDDTATRLSIAIGGAISTNGGSLTAGATGVTTLTASGVVTMNGGGSVTSGQTFETNDVRSFSGSNINISAIGAATIGLWTNGGQRATITDAGINAVLGGTTPAAASVTTLTASGDISTSQSNAGNFYGLQSRNTNAGAAAANGLAVGNNSSAYGLTMTLNSSAFTGAANYAYLLNQFNAPLILGSNGTGVVTISSTSAAVTGALSATTSVTAGAGSAGLVMRGYTGSSSYGALYRIGDTPADTNAALITNQSATIVSGTTSSSLAVTAVNVAVATSTGLAVTGVYEGAEQTAPSAPAANGYRIFAQDNGAGKTQLMVIFASGAAQQIAIQP